MKMYAIIDTYNEGFYYNFETGEFTMRFNEQCLLPTQDMAKTFIEEELGEDNKVVTVNIESYQNGVMSCSTNEDAGER